MSIRLNKAIKELNIGLQTAVDFLAKKPELGEVKNELSFKLNDAQHDALMAAFKGDKEVHSQAEKLFKKPEKEKKQKKEQPAPQNNSEAEKAVTPSDALIGRQAKPLGKIDLDALNGKPSKAEQKNAQSKEEPAKPKEEPAKPKEELKPKAEPVETVVTEKPEKQENTEKQDIPETPEKLEKPATPVNTENNDTSAAEKQEVEIFTLKSDRKTIARPNVIGTIDLDALNQSTHPKKKSKEERRKEREAKQSDKKKRNRIGKERVDVNDAANQQQGGKNGKNARTTAGKGGAQQQQGTGKKKKNKKKGQPQEVSEEDVARQVKETLARLTSKGTQIRRVRNTERRSVTPPLSSARRML